MGFEMEAEEVGAVLETIWDLHDKVSDAIHAISRAHFLRSVRAQRSPAPTPELATGEKDGGRFVYVKGFGFEKAEDEAAAAAAVAEARSLHAIRAALEDLEDQLEFFHNVQSQQRAERDVALTRLEQSRIILSMRLKDHHGKKYKVIDEALDFVHNVYQEVQSIPAENISEKPTSHSGDGTNKKEEWSNFLSRMIVSSLALAKNYFRIERVGGLLANSTVFAVSMVALMQLHRFTLSGQTPAVAHYRKMNQESTFQLDHSPQSSDLKHLDVLLAKG